MANKIYVATVSYEGYPGRRYDFLTDIPGLSQGNMVVVQAAPGLGIAQVVQIKDRSDKATAWVVCKIDLVAHAIRVKHHKEVKRLEREMDSYVEEHGKRAQYEALAAQDADMADLLERYDTLLEGESC